MKCNNEMNPLKAVALPNRVCGFFFSKIKIGK